MSIVERVLRLWVFNKLVLFPPQEGVFLFWRLCYVKPVDNCMRGEMPAIVFAGIPGRQKRRMRHQAT